MRPTEEHRQRLSLTLLFTGLVFLFLLLTTLVIVVVVLILMRQGMLQLGKGNLNTTGFVLILLLISVVTGTAITFAIGRVPLRPVNDIINALNHRYNELLGGKWRGMMALPPGVCALYQNKPEVTRWDGIGEKAVCPTPLVKTQSVVDLSQYNTKSADVSIIRGLGCDNMAIQLGKPHAEGEPFIEYPLPPVTGSECEVCLATVPFWPIYQGHTTTVAISVDDAEPQVFNNVFKEYSRTWKDQVMCNAAHCTLRFAINPEKTTHVLRISTREPGQMIQRISVVPIVSE